MCLNLKSKWTLPKIALKNIKCYKYVIGNGDDGSLILTPFQLKSVLIGKTYKSDLYKIDYKVDLGLHSLCNFNDIDSISMGNPIVECIIPFGSIFYKGKFVGKDSYASNKIKYVKFLRK